MSYLLEMRGITKAFPGVVANDDITLRLKRGEVLALLGENGAGKSTLMSVLFGLYAPDKGRILIDGKEVRIKSPNDANNYRIGMVHQHFQLVKTFTALQNIILGVESVKNGFLTMKESRKKLLRLTERYKLSVDPDMLAADMTVGMQQRVEILKMLYRENDILIFDEPSAVLTPQEIDELMDIMRTLVAEGKSIIFITHKLNEVMAIADRCTVLRKGRNVGDLNIGETTKAELSELMVGRKINPAMDKSDAAPGEPVLKLRDLCVEDKRTGKTVVSHVSFDVRAGEIVCIAGIDGNGQRELVHAIAGMTGVSSGTIALGGADCTRKSVRFRTENGMAHIPEDRHKHGLVLDFTLAENIALQTYYLPPLSRRGILDLKKMNEFADALIEKYEIHCGKGASSITGSMSGGNQQKAIIAREIVRNPKLLMAVQPTRGLDVGAIENIENQLIARRDAGWAVLLISLELEEVMNVSDRILVIFEGEIVAELDPKKTDFHELGSYMSGAKRSETVCS